MSEFSDKVEKTHIAFIHETARESLARDLGTGTMIVALWSLGAYADSAALEWCGVAMGLILISIKATAKLKGRIDSRMTPDQARKWLDENFPS